MAAVDALQSAPSKPARNPAAEPGSIEFVWRILRLLNVFRLGLGVLLLGAFYLLPEPRIIGESSPVLALAAILGMVAFSAVNLWLLREHQLSVSAQAYVQLAVDLAAISTLMHASGGVSSGVGGLLIISVGALIVFSPGRVR